MYTAERLGVVWVLLLLFILSPDRWGLAHAGQQTSTSPDSIENLVSREIVSVLPTAAQVAAYEVGQRPVNTSLFEFMVFGFEEEPVFKLDRLRYDVETIGDININIEELLSPFSDAGIPLERYDSIGERGIRYHLSNDERAYQSNWIPYRITPHFLEPLVEHRWHFATRLEGSQAQSMMRRFVHQQFTAAKRSAIPFCLHLADVTYRADYHRTNPDSPNADGVITPQPCPDCGDEITQLAVVAVDTSLLSDRSRETRSIQQCLVFRTLMLVGIREVAAADPARILVDTDDGVDFTSEVKCVLAALYNPEITQGMSKLETLRRARPVASDRCGSGE